MLHLPTVTLCCVDTRSVPQALEAVHRSTRAIRFGRVLFFGPSGDAHTHLVNQTPELEWRSIQPLRSIQDYNRFMLQELRPHIETDHVLVMQWDGFVSTPEAWQEAFLQWDYIGAPWYHGGHPGQVGNGGFSLRSRRLLGALAALELNTEVPEDMEICVHKRDVLATEHGIQIAPLSVAQSFACEYGTYRKAFGFHGMHNFAHTMTPNELHQWLDGAPAEILMHQHARKLIKALIEQKRTAEAIDLLDRRRRLLGTSMDDWSLRARVHLARLRLAH